METPPHLLTNSIDQVIAALSDEEKLRLITGYIYQKPRSPPIPYCPPEDYPSLLVNGESGTTNRISRLGIPETILSNGPAGLHVSPHRRDRTTFCTYFPVATLLASSWNLPLVEAIGTASRRVGV